MNATAIPERWQTTLPREVSEAAGLKPGDQVEWRFEDGEIRGRKLEPHKDSHTRARLVRKYGYLVAVGGPEITDAAIRKALDEFP